MAQLGLHSNDLQGTLLLRDSLEAPGSFLLTQLVKMALTGQAGLQSFVGPAAAAPPSAALELSSRRVILLAVAQTASHHVQVLRKAGLQAPALMSAGRLAVVDALAALSDGPLSLRTLHAQLVAATAAADGEAMAQAVCLVVDDLSVRLRLKVLAALTFGLVSSAT
jgi:hypothetical protein